MSVAGAQLDLEAAQKKLQALRSDELELLIKQYIREGIRDGSFATARRLLGRAERNLEHLRALLKWIEGEFPKIITEMERARHNRTRVPIPNRSSSRITSKKASQSHAPAYSVLRPTHSSKISKVFRRKESSHSREPTTARGGVLSSTRRTDNKEGGQQPTSKAFLRRSRRIPESIPSSPNPVHSQGLPSLLPPPRRSVRICERRGKLEGLKSDAQIRSSHSNQTDGQKSIRRAKAHSKAAYCGKPQGVSKVRGGSARSKRKQNGKNAHLGKR